MAHQIPVLPAPPGNPYLFYAMISSLPYPVMIFGPDGRLAFVNRAWETMFHVPDSRPLIGNYNVLDDPDMKRWGHSGSVLQAYQGNMVELHDVKAPLQEIVNKHGDRRLCEELLFHTICCFPIHLEAEEAPHVAVLYVTTREYHGRAEVLQGTEYIQKHWMEEFDLDRVAASVYISKYYFTRLFKKHTGMTPHEYYLGVKIEMLKEKLAEKNLSIAQSFAACGLSYTDSSATMFRRKVGMTPSEYRKFATEK